MEPKQHVWVSGDAIYFRTNKKAVFYKGSVVDSDENTVTIAVVVERGDISPQPCTVEDMKREGRYQFQGGPKEHD